MTFSDSPLLVFRCAKVVRPNPSNQIPACEDDSIIQRCLWHLIGAAFTRRMRYQELSAIFFLVRMTIVSFAFFRHLCRARNDVSVDTQRWL